jgi:hypothetical protein
MAFFEAIGGVPKEIPYDRTKTAVSEPSPKSCQHNGLTPASTDFNNKIRAEASILWPFPKQTKPICLLDCMGISHGQLYVDNSHSNYEQYRYRSI